MKKVLVNFIILLIVFSIIPVMAEDLKTVNFISDKTEIEKGEEIVLTISSEELTGIEGKIKYDSTVWTLSEKASQNSFTLNENTGKFALANIGGEEKISATITLKSEKETTVDSTIINLIGIVGSNKTGESFNISDKAITIKFKTEVFEDIPEEPVQDPAEDPVQKPVNTTKPTPTVNNTTNNVQKFPETGSENIFAVIAIVGIIAYISYFKYKKYNF
ncbi:MAG: hypothetical protein IJE59_01360 [Clostridia bacterium]|nr:hypothetical protein [Clostridia bacterium]